MKLSKLLSLLVLSSLFAFSSCGDDDGDFEPVTKNCQLTKITDEDGVTNITYSQDKVISFSTPELGQVTIQYNTAGKPTKLDFAQGGERDGIEYVYDNQGRLDELLFSNEDLEIIYGVENAGSILVRFEYNGNRISKAERFLVVYNDVPLEEDFYELGYDTYSYHSNGNLSEKKFYFNGNLQSTTEYTTYDNKVNPNTFLEGLTVGLPENGPPSPNNVVTVVTRSGNTINKDESYTNVYVYNESGYPTKVTKTTQNGDITVTEAAYACK